MRRFRVQAAMGGNTIAPGQAVPAVEIVVPQTAREHGGFVLVESLTTEMAIDAAIDVLRQELEEVRRDAKRLLASG